MSYNKNSFAQFLDSLKGKARINISDQYIGDDGAKIFSKFLRENEQVKVLELKGNNIGPQGIKEIFSSLQSSTAIKSIFCEWNSIGRDVEGINAVAGFVLNNKSIEHLGLSNNKISGEDVDSLANCLRNNKQLLSLDLKWNELGTKGGVKLLNSIKENDTLLYLEVNGNNISEDIFENIEKITQKNRLSNNIPKDQILGINQDQLDFDDNGQGQGEEFNQRIQGNTGLMQSQQQQNQGTATRLQRQTNPRDSDGLAMIHHLEQILEQERYHTQQTKLRLEAELDELQRKDRNELRTVQELDAKCADLSNQNKMIKFDIDRLRDEFTIIEKSNNEQIKTHEDRIRQNDFLIDEMEKKHKITLEKLNQDNNYRAKELNRDWESRVRSLEERIRMMEMEGRELESELQKVNQRNVDLKIQQDEELRDLTKRIEEDEYQKYQANLTNLNARIQAIEEGHELYLNRNKELVEEYQRRDQEVNDEIYQQEAEVNELKKENEQFLKKNNEFKIQCDKIDKDNELKKNIIDKLQKEINSLNDIIKQKTEFGKDQLQRTLKEQESERKNWESERELQLKQIETLEKSLRDIHAENSRLKLEYLKLSEVVQANVNKSIFKTFTDNHYY